MLLLAHTGITLGAAYILQQVVKQKTMNPASLNAAVGKTAAIQADDTQKLPGVAGKCSAFWRELATKVDYRIILVGSLLPDLIDKPLGNVFLNHVFANGRIFSHTLLFLLLIVALAIILFHSKGQVWGFYLLFGTITHFLLDEIWLTPGTLFWPFLGITFAKYPEMGTIALLMFWLKGLFTEPAVYIAEIIGCLTLVFFGVKILAKREVKAFLWRGII